MNINTRTITFFILIGLLLSVPYWNAKGDDAFILFRYVKNFVEHGQFAYNLGEPTYGFTSPAWLFFLSSVYFIFRDIYISVWIVSVLSMIFFVTTMWLLIIQVIKNRPFQLLFMFSILCDFWIQRWAFSGQEITFKLAVCAGVLAYASRYANNSGHSRERSPVILGILLSFSLFTRPEFILLCGIALAILIRRKEWKSLAIVVTIVAVTYGSWALFCHIHFGWFVPHTILVKTGSSYGWEGTFREVSSRIGGLILPAVPVFAVSIGAVLHKRMIRKLFQDNITVLMIVLWVSGSLAGYLISHAPLTSMYYVTIVPFIVCLCIYALENLIGEDSQLSKRYIVISATASVCIYVAVFSFRLGVFSWIVSDKYNNGDDKNYIEYAEWIDANTPKSARIGITELGVVGWFGNRYMIDLAGIATPEFKTGDPKVVMKKLLPTHFSLYGPKVDSVGDLHLEEMYCRKIERIGGGRSVEEYRVYKVVK